MKELYFEEQLSDENSFLDLFVEVGSVEIRPGNGRVVTVEAEVQNIIVDVYQKSNVIFVEAHTDKKIQGNWFERLRNGDLQTKAKLIIHIPPTCEIKAKTTTGSVDIQEINAPTTIRTTTGSVHLADIGGPIYAKVITGKLSYNGVLMNDNHRFETTTGSIQLNLAKEPNARLDATTITGNIHCDFPLTNEQRKSHLTGGKIRGTLGSGEGKIKAKTTTGSLRVVYA